MLYSARAPSRHRGLRAPLVLFTVGIFACWGLASQARAATPGLVAAYAFSESAGTTTADQSGKNHTGTLSNVARTTSGRYGRALSFNGTSSIVRVADAADLDLTTGMTSRLGSGPRAASPEPNHRVEARAGGGFPYGLELNAGRPGGFAEFGSVSKRADSPTGAAIGVWTFVATTFDGATIRTYRNGTKVAETPAAGTISASADALEIGADTAWGEHFQGVIDNVRVYARAVTATELAADSAADVAPTATPTPTPTATPTPTPTGTNCMPDPSKCGFPDVENTGVNPLISRTAVSGSVVLSTAGQIYENKTVTGDITVTAPNVTIRNVKLVNRNPYYAISVKSGGDWGRSDANLVVERSEIDLGGRYTVKGIAFNGYTARGVFFHNGADCAHFGNNVVLQDNLCVGGPNSMAMRGPTARRLQRP